MTQLVVQNINNVFRYKERIFSFLALAIVISAFSYVYFLHQAISNVVARESVAKDSRSLSTAVSELEAKYFQVKNTINIELAHEKGFRDSEVTSFISKKSLTAMANHHEF